MTYVLLALIFLIGCALLGAGIRMRPLEPVRIVFGTMIMAIVAVHFVQKYARDYVVVEQGVSADITVSDEPAPYSRYFGETCKAHRMTVVDAGATWCGYCKRMEAETFADPSVRSSMIDDGFVKVTEEADPEIILALNVKAYPTVIFLDRECREIHRSVGFRDPGRFLKEIAAARGKLPAAQ